MNELSLLSDFLISLGYNLNGITFAESIDLLTSVKSVVNNRIGAPKITNKPTGVGVSGAMSGEVKRSCDLSVNQ
jgi:hypothetical protein